MNRLECIATIFVTVLLLSAAGCASTSESQGTQEYVDDSMITAKVKAAIFNESTLNSIEIHVDTIKGVVQLSGFVSTQANIYKAAEVTRNVDGVTNVRNDMRLKH